jgi:hypothetical protein
LAVAIVAFPIAGLTIQIVQPIAGLALGVSTAAIARSVVRPPSAVDEPTALATAR